LLRDWGRHPLPIPLARLCSKEQPEVTMLTFGMPSHLDFSVTDVEASATWYAAVFKLRRLKRVDLDNRSVIMLIHPGTGLIVGLNRHSTIPVSVFDDRNVGLDHIGFAVG